MQRQAVTGFTNQYSIKARCDRCDLGLGVSTYKGIKIVYSKSKSRAHGFLCVTCATRQNKNQNVLATIEELDAFVSYLISKVVKWISNQRPSKLSQIGI